MEGETHEYLGIFTNSEYAGAWATHPKTEKSRCFESYKSIKTRKSKKLFENNFSTKINLFWYSNFAGKK